MWLKHLSIQHFRNYQELEVEFHPGLNIFLGQNAQGKTNILESIYFLALTRSHRTRNDRDLIYFESTDFKVSGQLQRETGPLPLEISLTPKGRITKVFETSQIIELYWPYECCPFRTRRFATDQRITCRAPKVY